MQEGRDRREGNHDCSEGFVIDTGGLLTAGGGGCDRHRGGRDRRGGIAKPSSLPSAGLCRDPKFTLTSCLNWSNWSGGNNLFDQPPCSGPDKGSLTSSKTGRNKGPNLRSF